MSFASLINQTVTLHYAGTYDRYGNPAFGNGADYPARVKTVNKDKLMPNGEQVNINLQVWLRGDVLINLNDKLIYSGTKYKIVGKTESITRDGSIHHLVLDCTSWVLA